MSEQPKYRIELFWSEGDGGYIANIPELKYTSAFGETREEALHEVQIAEALHLETLEEMGRSAPEPGVEQALQVDELEWVGGSLLSEATIPASGFERAYPFPSGTRDPRSSDEIFVVFQNSWRYGISESKDSDDMPSQSIIEDDEFLARLTGS